MSRNEFICDCTAVHTDVVDTVMERFKSNPALDRLTAFFKVMGDPTRVKILWALDQHEMCVCDIANVLSMTKSAVSHQLSTLRASALVRCRRDNKTVYYSLSDEHVQQILERALEHVSE
ncbi:MAG: metalloregulator ArsR/SmtB family transcription factor [Eubacteriales bacterium]|nr:metalloregulator ArsR/SmtB family transcription factor [Eubacteriales bacterium]MDD3880654.1 metalloregulator ArsR/SmtB family transcription factor [Eubacteriales bacterium]MDD4513559.1 metalloregulator ArsR/SmtB family transcription factor [Eubacteriales bacterium]